MARHRPRIIVIGAGIIGSAITYNLAIRGADALLLERGSAPGAGVTRHAFGWVNVINGTPGASNYALWRKAVDEYRHLEESLPEAFSDVRCGSFLWKTTAQETEHFASLHQEAGESVELWNGNRLKEVEPRLRRVPDIVVFSPNDLALDPWKLAQDLVTAAIDAGASARFDVTSLTIEIANGAVSGVNVGRETIAADIIIVAAGAGVQELLEPLGIDTGLSTSPALLLRYSCNQPVIRHILRAPRLEIRQSGDNTLLVAKSYAANGDSNTPHLIGENILSIMKDELDLPNEVRMKSAEIGERPIFADDLPRMGAVTGIDKLYLAVGHPGVILAPLIGRNVAQDILGE